MYNASRHSFFTFHLNCLEIPNSWLLVPLPLFKYISYMFTARGFAYLVQFAKLRLSQPHCFIHKPHMGKASLKKVEFCIKFAPIRRKFERVLLLKSHIQYLVICEIPFEFARLIAYGAPWIRVLRWEMMSSQLFPDALISKNSAALPLRSHAPPAREFPKS